jgi:hypothetical protein
MRERAPTDRERGRGGGSPGRAIRHGTGLRPARARGSTRTLPTCCDAGAAIAGNSARVRRCRRRGELPAK